MSPYSIVSCLASVTACSMIKWCVALLVETTNPATIDAVSLCEVIILSKKMSRCTRLANNLGATLAQDCVEWNERCIGMGDFWGESLFERMGWRVILAFAFSRIIPRIWTHRSIVISLYSDTSMECLISSYSNALICSLLCLSYRHIWICEYVHCLVLFHTWYGKHRCVAIERWHKICLCYPKTNWK